MNRRHFLKTTIAAGVAGLIDTWFPVKRHRIDLQAFCAVAPISNRFEMSKPFIQTGLLREQLTRYATDCRICVRVPAEPDETDCLEVAKAPPANLLPWWLEERGWKPWPRKDWLEAADTFCPDCEDDGFTVRNGEAVVCKTCEGRGHGTFPGIQRIGDLFIGHGYDDKIRRHLGDCEYTVIESFRPLLHHNDRTTPLISFRFDGGRGLLIPLDDKIARRRLEVA